MNPDIDPDKVKEGQTILLPAGKLSSRDKEILEGIGNVYRVYPVRKGESLKDVITKRNISRQEMVNLNPGVNLDRLKGGGPPAAAPAAQPAKETAGGGAGKRKGGERQQQQAATRDTATVSGGSCFSSIQHILLAAAVCCSRDLHQVVSPCTTRTSLFTSGAQSREGQQAAAPPRTHLHQVLAGQVLVPAAVWADLTAAHAPPCWGWPQASML